MLEWNLGDASIQNIWRDFDPEYNDVVGADGSTRYFIRENAELLAASSSWEYARGVPLWIDHSEALTISNRDLVKSKFEVAPFSPQSRNSTPFLDPRIVVLDTQAISDADRPQVAPDDGEIRIWSRVSKRLMARIRCGFPMNFRQRIRYF